MLSGCQLTGIGAAEYGYVALHGTGTPLGDPIEMGALGQALALPEEQPHTIAVGSVKSCYGHSEGAAGLTGTMLAIQAPRLQVQSRTPALCCYLNEAAPLWAVLLINRSPSTES